MTRQASFRAALRLLIVVLLGTPLVGAGQGPAAPVAAPAALTVGGDVRMPMTFTPDALKALPRGDSRSEGPGWPRGASRGRAGRRTAEAGRRPDG